MPPNFLGSKVKKAREAIQARMEDIVESHLETISMAVADGNYDAALKAQQWLMEHAEDDEGSRVVGMSVDKPKQVEGHTGPTIQIGFALGGVPVDQKALPQVIDMTPTGKHE